MEETVPEWLQTALNMFTDEYEIGEEFDFRGVTMVRADSPHPHYYPKEIGPTDLLNVHAIRHAREIEPAIQEMISRHSPAEK